MPIYEYRCASCGHRFEKLIRNEGDLPESCPECGTNSLKKLFSSFSALASASRATPCADGALDPRSCPAAASPACASGRCPMSS